MKRVGYAKFGRSMNFDLRNLYVGAGDVDAVNLLHRLAKTHQDVQFDVMGTNTGQFSMLDNVKNWWSPGGLCDGISPDQPERYNDVSAGFLEVALGEVLKLDGFVLWAGQHGSSNSLGMPALLKEGTTSPYMQCVRYGSYLVKSINTWRDAGPGREEVWLNADWRNYLKARDFKHPLRNPVLTQFPASHRRRHYQYGEKPSAALMAELAPLNPEWDGTFLTTDVRDVYAGVELIALPDVGDPDDILRAGRERRQFPVGVIANESRSRRAEMIRDWVTSIWDGSQSQVFGVWSAKGMSKIGRLVEPVPWHDMEDAVRSWTCTVALPFDGPGWPTAKAWEAFRVGTVCFLYPGYDKYGEIVPIRIEDCRNSGDVLLMTWLRPSSAAEFKMRVDMVCEDGKLRNDLVAAQYDRLTHKWGEWRGGIRGVEERLGLDTTRPVQGGDAVRSRFLSDFPWGDDVQEELERELQPS